MADQWVDGDEKALGTGDLSADDADGTQIGLQGRGRWGRSGKCRCEMLVNKGRRWTGMRKRSGPEISPQMTPMGRR
jgi:hypothetical protein